jgi:Tol biopolymer transport system component
VSVRRLLAPVTVAACAVLCGLVSAVSAGAAKLPDGRVYERVSSMAAYGSEVYQPQVSVGVQGDSRGTPTRFPFQSAADGDRVAYVGGPTSGGSELSGAGRGNEYLGTRSADGGWTQTNISPAGVVRDLFQEFSSDLSVAFLDSAEPLSSLAPGFGETPSGYRGNYDIPYQTSTSQVGEYTPLLTTKPPYRSMESFETAPPPAFYSFEYGRTIAIAGASSDLHHLLFLANDALTGASEGRPAAEGGTAGGFETKSNLYEWFDGQLRLVNVLPDGTTHVNATFGSGLLSGLDGTGGATSYEASHVISSDGSRIFWTDLATGHIYVRENGTTTVEISATGKYQTAASDGSVVFYTNGDLYEYELEGARTTDLTPGVPVEKVVGASEDGRYVYYLTTGGELKLWHGGVTTTIATTPVANAEVTPDGHSVVYENYFESPGSQIHVYDAENGQLYCASCHGGGTHGFLVTTNAGYFSLPHWMSSDGSRVFFDTPEALVPQDTNGKLDVYEWERPGTGGCSEVGGCVYLLSEATSTQGSYFAEASESGDDVFIVTRAKLVETDEDELFDLYDARVNGAVPVVPPECTGTGCQGIPSAPPIFATPSSVTFGGVGNFAAPAKEAKAKPKPKPKKKSKHKKKKGKSKAGKSARKASGHRRSGTRGGRS